MDCARSGAREDWASTPVQSSPAVKTSVPGLAARFREAARTAGFREEPFGQAGDWPLFALTRRTPGPWPRIYLSAGIHGDEPAPPLALLELLEAGGFERQATWFLCPLLNPRGLAAGTRENPDGLDLNRDYRDPQSEEVRAHVDWLRRQPRFDLAICVHEDWEAKGYYLYEQNPFGRPSLAEPLLQAARAHCPIDPSELIDGREAKQGIIHPPGDIFAREKWPESIYLRAHHTGLAYTVETPSGLPLEARVAAHCASLAAALRAFFAHTKSA